MSTDSKFSTPDMRQKMPWLIIARSVTVALDFRAIIFAAIALVATTAGWRMLDSVFSGSKDATLKNWAPRTEFVEDSDGVRLRDENNNSVMVPDRPWPWEDETADERIVDARGSASLVDLSWWLDTPLIQVWNWFTTPAKAMFDEDTGFTGFVCLLLSIIWAVIVWGLFAGAITRYAAVALTTDERLGWQQMFWQARVKWLSYVSAPMIPIIAALLFAIPMVIGGWILHIPQVGPFLIGLGWFLAIIGGIVMAVTLVPPLFGWPFMWSTVSTEGSDAMDGCSRCYSYVWQRPLHFLCYLLFAGLLSWISLLLVNFLVEVIGGLSIWAVSLGAGDELMTKFREGNLEGLSDTGSLLFGFWMGALKLVIPAYAFAFFFTAMTAIYLLLRYEIDAAELDEVFLEAEPELLAALGEDIAGVPTAGVPTAPAAESSTAGESEPDDET